MDANEDRRPHIVIVGAGFGGVAAARRLARREVKITLIDRRNYHLFQPLLYQVSTAGLSVDDIAYPVRAIFREHKNVDFRMAEVTGVDLAAKKVLADTGEIAYDYLLAAAGGETNFFGMEALERNAFGMKTLDEAVSIRNHVLWMFERAVYETDAARRRSLLTFVVVGGGATGVEEAGALSELMYHVMEREHHSLNFKEVRIILVEASDRLLPALPEKLREATVRTLRRKRVEVRRCVQVVGYDGQYLTLQGGERIPTRTVIWAAGVKAAALAGLLGGGRDRSGRVIVNEFLQVDGRADVYAIGDMAHFQQDGRPLPMVAPVANQQAVAAADNITRDIQGRELKPFAYQSVGYMATIGRSDAVVSMGRYQSHGFWAWVFWSVVHVWRLVGFRNRTVVFVKWIWDYLFYERIARIITRQ